MKKIIPNRIPDAETRRQRLASARMFHLFRVVGEPFLLPVAAHVSRMGLRFALRAAADEALALAGSDVCDEERRLRSSFLTPHVMRQLFGFALSMPDAVRVVPEWTLSDISLFAGGYVEPNARTLSEFSRYMRRSVDAAQHRAPLLFVKAYLTSGAYYTTRHMIQSCGCGVVDAHTGATLDQPSSFAYIDAMAIDTERHGEIYDTMLKLIRVNGYSFPARMWTSTNTQN